MSKPLADQPYSYRADQTVPGFNDAGPVVVMDGSCALCTATARWIARRDWNGAFRIARAQGEVGGPLLRHYGLDPADPDSWLYIETGQVYTSLDAVLRIGARLGGIGWLLQPLRVLPTPAGHWLYRCVARNRYRVFGRTDMCAVPDPALRYRLID